MKTTIHMKKYIIFLLLLGTLYVQTFSQNIEGTIYKKSTKKTAEGVLISYLNKGNFVITDSTGKYAFPFQKEGLLIINQQDLLIDSIYITKSGNYDFYLQDITDLGGVKVESKKMPVDETNFPDDVLDSEFAAYNGTSIVNSTTWSV